MTTTPTGGAADLPDAMHMAELLENPINVVCQKTAAAVLRHQHSELERLHALAGQATAAQQGVAYAALPEPLSKRPSEANTLVWVADPISSTGVRGVFVDDITCLWWWGAGLIFQKEADAAALALRMRSAIASHGQAPATQQAGIPGNFITHRAAWREALETAKFVSTGVDRSYWDHELAAFDRSFDRLWTLMQDAARKQGAPHDK